VIPWTRNGSGSTGAARTARGSPGAARSARGDLRTADRELEELSTERRQHELLGAACGALEELSQIGGRRACSGANAPRRAAATSRSERARPVAGFQKRLSEIEERRQEALDEVMRQRRTPTGSRATCTRRRRRQERRAEEWTVVREISALPLHDVIDAVGARRRGRRALPASRSAPRSRSASCSRSCSAGRAAGVRAGRALALPDRVVRLMARSGRWPRPARTGAARGRRRSRSRGAGAAATKPKVGPSKGAGEARGRSGRAARVQGAARWDQGEQQLRARATRLSKHARRAAPSSAR